MKHLIDNPDFLCTLVNKQFQMIGEPNVTLQELDKIGGVEVMEGKKKKVIDWAKYYYFQSEEQYMEWKTWAANKLVQKFDLEEHELQQEINFLDLVFGLTVKLKKEGELF